MYVTPDYLHAPLYVIAPIFNPMRYKARWKHYQRFAAMVKAAGAVLVTVEASFGDRHHALDVGETQHGTPIYGEAPTKAAEFHRARTTEPHLYIKVAVEHELWLKENLINVGISRLPADWQYVAWVDTDLLFVRPNWVGETIHQLQHFQLVQMFSEVTDVGPRYATVTHHRGFMHCYSHRIPRQNNMPGHAPDGHVARPGEYGPGVIWHPGYAWAARREAIDALGGLLEHAILGAGDNHMACALIGDPEASLHPGLSEAYRRRVLEWAYRAEHHIRRDVGYMSGLVVHYWHGKKADRQYWDRWRILTENQFDPDLDLKHDWQGCLQLVDRFDGRSIALRDGLRNYFRQRNEDSIDV